MKQKAVLEIRDGSYSYEEGALALDHVNVTICENEKIAVIGANGAGKSTFFLCMNGVVELEEGSVIFEGRHMGRKEFKELRRHVGIVFQDADSQIIASTVMSEVSFGPMNLKLPKAEVVRRTEEALNYMNLEEFKDRAPHHLSGGEKKRVSIADIIAMEPEIIVFDEPATGLDPLNQQVLEEVLGRLTAEGKTVLLSTHDVDFAYRFADRVLVFSKGRIIAEGTPEDIFKDREVLLEAHLKRPVLLQMYEALVEKGVLKRDNNCPKSVTELLDML